MGQGHWKVLVVDDHQLMLDAVRAALAGEDEFEIVADARTAEDALALAGRHRPDVVLLDLRMPGVSGLDCIAKLTTGHATKVVILSGVDDDATVREAIEAGASAFVSKLVDPRDLASTLRQVVEETVVSPAPRREEPGNAPLSTLTERELEILGHAASGAPNKEIGRVLCLSEQTVKYHLSRVYAKLGVQGRVDAVRVAVANRLVESSGARK